MNAPAIYNFPTAYGNDGMEAFKITLKHAGGDPLDLSGARIDMQMRNTSGGLVWSFSTAEGSDTLLTLMEGGVISFPKINSWIVTAGTYSYDLQSTDSSGFVRTYLKGTWRIIPDITKTV